VAAELTPLRGLNVRLPSPVDELKDERTADLGLRVYLKRDDLIHPEIPGNKWRKLKYNLAEARRRNQRTLLTFGGAYSNNIRATAAAGYHYGFSTIGVVRGEERLPLNPILAYAVEHGMHLAYLDRSRYRNKTSDSVIEGLRDQFGDFYLLPEGGSNGLAVRGCSELPAEIATPFDVICCAVGTGGTLAGIAAGLPDGPRAMGFATLKGGGFLVDDVRRLQEAFGRVTQNWSIETNYHFGGFARRTPELDGFVEEFRAVHGITLDWVYEAKMMYGLFAEAAAGAFDRGTVIVAVLAG
jgi:1-aminocyclopropane-1-carboxylate deaminase